MSTNPCFVGAAVITGLLAAAAALPDKPSATGGQQEEYAQDAQDARLERQLDRLDNVASLYRNAALKFSCREQIAYHPGTPGVKVYDLEYMYVYDKQKGLLDYRNDIPARGRSGKTPREVSLTELGLPSVVTRAYSMIFIFERSKRDNYHYAIVRDENVLGRDAVVIRFEAVPPYRPDYNDWFGLAWVDSKTAQLLKVEALKARQYEESQRMEADLAGSTPGPDASVHDYIIEKIQTEFAVEHRGLRFPNRVLIRRSRYHVGPRDGARVSKEHPIFWIEQSYSKYNFYDVRAHEQSRGVAPGGESSERQP